MQINNETKIGALTIIALATLYLGYSFLKGKAVFSKQQVFYAVYENVGGLNVTDQVQINGVQVGRVTAFTINRSSGDIIARFVVEHDIAVPKNTRAKIIRSDFLGQKVVQLQMGDTNLIARSGDTLRSSTQLSMTETMQHEVLPVIRDFSKTIDKINRGEGSLGKLINDDSLYHNLNSSARNLDKLLINMRTQPDRYVNFSLFNVSKGKNKQ